MTVALAAAFALAAYLRARRMGPVVITARYVVLAAATAAALAVVDLLVHPALIGSLALALAAVCCWTDLVARKVYLSTTLPAMAGGLTLLPTRVDELSALLGFCVLGGIAALVAYRVPDKFGAGDAAWIAAQGVLLGLEPALLVVDVMFVTGAVIASILILTRRVGRRYPFPLAAFGLTGVAVVVISGGRSL